MNKIYVSLGTAILSIPFLWISYIWASLFYIATTGDDSTGAIITSGDGTQFEVREPYHNGDYIQVANTGIKYHVTIDAISPDVIRDGSDPRGILGFRCLRNALIGVSQSGYFIYDNRHTAYFLTSDYNHWRYKVRELGIADDTLLFPGPVRKSYAKRGWLEYHPNAEKKW